MKKIPKFIIITFTFLSILAVNSNAGSNKLNIVGYAQEQTMWCWAACSETILKYNGISDFGKQCTLVDYAWNKTTCCNNPGSCNNPNQMCGNGSIEDIVEHWGIGTECIWDPINQSKIKSEIDDSSPFVIFITGHFLTGYGYEDDGNSVHYWDVWPPNQGDWQLKTRSYLINTKGWFGTLCTESTGAAPPPPPTPGEDSCVNSSGGDYCGQKSPDGCWCDDMCGQYGDCCPDYEQGCNGSGPTPTPQPTSTPTPNPTPNPTPTPTPGEEGLTNGQAITISETKDSWKHFFINVPSGATNLSIKMSGGSGDADLYTRFGAQPTTSSYDCRPYQEGNDEECTVANPQTGKYYVSIHAFSTCSNVGLMASYDTGDPPGPIPDDSCEGRCGNKTPGGCWCDNLCTQYNDCCEDKQEQCGY
jgi:hypothetical protein